MILSKDSNNNWTPTAGGTGTFIGTLAAFNAIKDTLPVNTVAYITDDGNGDLQPVDAVTDGDMHPVTSNAVYDKLKNRFNGMNMTITTSNGTAFSTKIRLKAQNYVSIYIIGDQGIYIINVNTDVSEVYVNTLIGSNPPINPTLTLNSDGSYQLAYTYATGVYSRQLIIS